MNRSCVWFCTLTAATAAAVSDARAFPADGPGAPRMVRFIAGPEQRGPGSAPSSSGKQSAPSGSYSFSGSSFNLSVTKNGRGASAPPPPANADSGAERPSLIRRMLDWAFGE